MRLGTYYRAALLGALGLRQVEGPVLDVGGYDGYWLSSLNADRRVSIDLDPQPSFSGVSYLQGDGLRLPFRDNSFAVVYALDVIEHVDDDRRLASELLRVLRPGGRLFLTTPHRDVCIFPPFLQSWANRRWQHFRTPGYAPSALHNILSAEQPEGIRIRQLKTWGFRQFYLPLSALWRLRRGLAQRAAHLTARLDSGQTEGPRGYLLAEVTK